MDGWYIYRWESMTGMEWGFFYIYIYLRGVLGAFEIEIGIGRKERRGVWGARISWDGGGGKWGKEWNNVYRS